MAETKIMEGNAGGCAAGEDSMSLSGTREARSLPAAALRCPLLPSTLTGPGRLCGKGSAGGVRCMGAQVPR